MNLCCFFLPLLALTTAAPLAHDLESALRSDDQCLGDSDAECVLSVVQLRGLKAWETQRVASAAAAAAGLEDDMGEELNDEDMDSEYIDEDRELLLEEGEILHGKEDHGLEWLKDISVSTKNALKKRITPLQKPIVAEYQELLKLDAFANYTMAKVANATGEKVIWNAKSTVESLLENSESKEENAVEKEGREEDAEATVSRVGRRRRHSSQSLPPRARFVNKLLIYLDKEVQAVWALHALVDRKRWGIGNTITSHPYGPHGEHPDSWKPTGDFPFPVIKPSLTVTNSTRAIVSQVKAHSHTYKNKYATQLQQDYEALVANIKDVYTKTDDLRKRLQNMDGYADEFISRESGIFDKITIG
eukprot:gb/GFBE01005500.1/.p1 GENE.gb/GFBE01005500.1/~~gb/GFBE01005500.1/.p1  ORF type:complete len:360 (+),score=75.96 gb/GFBE01005500.1/:1-1080(+)